MNNSDEISRYFSYLNDQIRIVDELSAVANDFSKRKMCKVVYNSILEAFAKAAFPNEHSSGNRYKRLIREFSLWINQDKASIFILKKYIERCGLLSGKEMLTYLNDIYSIFHEKRHEWSDGYDVTIDNDPNYTEIMEYFVEYFGEDAVNKSKLDRVKHVNILYENRNALVHEFRDKLGSWENISKADEPHYVSFEEDGVDKWNLVYPLKFYKKLCVQVSDVLEIFFRSKDINPFDAYKWGDYVYDEINE